MTCLSAWPRLHTLSLFGLEITDAALPRIAACRSLAVLDLSATEIHDPSPLVALPRLRILGLAETRLSPAGAAAAKRLAARGVEIVRGEPTIPAPARLVGPRPPLMRDRGLTSLARPGPSRLRDLAPRGPAIAEVRAGARARARGAGDRGGAGAARVSRSAASWRSSTMAIAMGCSGDGVEVGELGTSKSTRWRSRSRAEFGGLALEVGGGELKRAGPGGASTVGGINLRSGERHPRCRDNQNLNQ